MADWDENGSGWAILPLFALIALAILVSLAGCIQSPDTALQSARVSDSTTCRPPTCYMDPRPPRPR